MSAVAVFAGVIAVFVAAPVALMVLVTLGGIANRIVLGRPLGRE